MADTENVNIFIKTFDGFDVYVNGKMLYFPSSKAKEMLAIMVEKRGSSVSLSQMTYLLYENIEERTAKNNLRVVYYRLRMNLMEHGIEQILIKKRGSYAVDTELFICDFYEFIKGNSDYITLFQGVICLNMHGQRICFLIFEIYIENITGDSYDWNY